MCGCASACTGQKPVVFVTDFQMEEHLSSTVRQIVKILMTVLALLLHYDNSLEKKSPQNAKCSMRPSHPVFISKFNDIEGRKKSNTETCLHNAKEVAAFATQFKPGHWCSLDPASEYGWWNGNSTEPQGELDIVALQMVAIFKCHTTHPTFAATEPVSLGHLVKEGRNYHFQRTFDNQTLLINTILASNLLCIYHRICQLYEKSTSISNPNS